MTFWRDGRLAGRAAEGRGVGAGDDLDALAGDEAVGLARRRGRVHPVAHHEDELLAHDPAALVDHVAHDLVALEVPLALEGERAGQRLEHADLVLALEVLCLRDADSARASAMAAAAV